MELKTPNQEIFEIALGLHQNAWFIKMAIDGKHIPFDLLSEILCVPDSPKSSKMSSDVLRYSPHGV